MNEKKRKVGIPRLLEIAGTKRWWLIASMVLAVGSAIAQFIPFISVYMVLSELAIHAQDVSQIDVDYIWHWGFIALWAMVVYGALLFVSTMCSHIAAFNILYELRMSLARKLVRLPMGFFTKRTSGDIKKVMSEDVERIELFIAHHIPDITCAVVFPILVIAYLCYIDWRLALVIIGIFAVAMLVMSAMMNNERTKDWTNKYQFALGQMNSSIVEYVRGIQVVKVFNRSTNAFERLTKSINDYRDTVVGITYRYAPTYLRFYTVISSTFLFLVPVAVYLLLHSPSYPAYVPTVLLFLVLGGGIFFPLFKLMWIGGLMSQNSTGVALVDEILDRPEINDPAQSLQPKDASVEFSDVSFAYDEKTVIEHVSFKANPGTVTALVGPSGSGKSTIAMLTARFWDVASGEIRIGGVPIHQIATSDLMEHIAFVFQDNMLFFDTIEENIRMGNKAATYTQVVEAAKAAQCHEFIEKLEKGYQTLVGEGGTYLSGGEQQRISLARAILKDAPIVLLDEATAYADPENEGKILDSFAQLIKGKTVLVIAHRLSTITNAHQILLVDNGQIAERGTHEELLSLNGHYATMWDTYSQSREWTIKVRKGETR